MGVADGLAPVWRQGICNNHDEIRSNEMKRGLLSFSYSLELPNGYFGKTFVTFLVNSILWSGNGYIRKT